MSLHLVTGYAGVEHITSADQGAYNMGTYGEGEFVLNRGNKFTATIVTNNSINVADGEAIMQGRFIKMPAGTSEAVAIENGTQGMNRKDLICIRYEKNSNTGVESASFVVKKGTESSGTPADPSYTHGDITDGDDLVNEMPLYRVNLSGLTISSIDTMYSLKISLVDYMDNYQLPVASSSVLGGVKIGGEGVSLDANNKLQVNAPGTSSISGKIYGTRGGIRKVTDSVKKWLFGYEVDSTTGVLYEYTNQKIAAGLGNGGLEYNITCSFNDGVSFSSIMSLKVPLTNMFNVLNIPYSLQSASKDIIKKFIDNNVIISNIDLMMVYNSSDTSNFHQTYSSVKIETGELVSNNRIELQLRNVYIYNDRGAAEGAGSIVICGFVLYGITLHANSSPIISLS